MSLNASKRPFDTFQEPNGTSQSETSSAKRPRAEPTLWDMITALPLATTHSLIYYACEQNPSLSATVQTSYADLQAAEAAKPAVDFDSYSKECWHVINRKYAGLSGSKQYDAVGDIITVLSSSRDAILEQAGPETKWETRRNALEVLRKIAKSIMLCEVQLIRHELLKTPEELGEFADAMVELARGMTEEERERYKREGLYGKLVDLQTSCDWENDMEGLRELYEIFDGPADEDDEEEQDDENDDENDRGEIYIGSRGSDDENAVEEEVNGDGSATKPYTFNAPDVAPQRSRVFSVSDLL